MRNFVLAILALAVGYAGYQALTHHSLVDENLTSSLAQINPLKDKGPDTPWVPPAVIPAQPNWTWTTTDGKVYHNVKIVRIDAACVTIVHSDGGGRVPISTLSADMQKYFNYDPAAAAKADADFQSGVKEEQKVAAEIAQQTADQKVDAAALSQPDFYRVTNNYSTAVAQAKAANKLLLLHFTGSDWCPACKMMEAQILSMSTFQTFSAANFVVVTLDYPRGFQLSAELTQQNASLSEKYHVAAFPTLVVTDLDGSEMARTEGCPETPGVLIADLKQKLAK